MRGISTLNLLLKGSLFAAALTAGSFNASSQQCTLTTGSNCTVPVSFDFNNLQPGETGGFSGDFIYDGPQSNNANSPTYALQTTTPLTSPKKLITPSFVIPDGATSIDYTFELGGNGLVTDFDVYLMFTDGTPEYALCQDLSVTYNNSGSLKICVNSPILISQTNKRARLRFEFTTIAANGSIENKIVTFDNFGLYAGSSQITLPVNFVGFTAKSVTRGTQLNWNVADEVNVSRYEVLKGSDASNLKQIGLVFAGEKGSYTFVDENPSQGITYYRIKSVDVDGKFKYSTVISYSNGKSASVLRAYPMPARNEITLQHGAIEGKAQISITSESGQIMKRVVPATGSMQTSIDLSTLKAGLYLLRLENSNGEVETLKVVKQ